MPNWCDCELTVSAPAEGYIVHFRASVTEEDNVISANKIIPYPKKFADQDRLAKAAQDAGVPWGDPRCKDGFNSGGYEWCLDNWGTKWGFCHAGIMRETKRTVKYRFDTAWSPPIPLILAASVQHPRCTFTLRYWERGMCFKGVYKAKAGQVIEDFQDEYHGNRGG